jgi:hypothetical protein
MPINIVFVIWFGHFVLDLNSHQMAEVDFSGLVVSQWFRIFHGSHRIVQARAMRTASPYVGPSGWLG